MNRAAFFLSYDISRTSDDSLPAFLRQSYRCIILPPKYLGLFVSFVPFCSNFRSGPVDSVSCSSCNKLRCARVTDERSFPCLRLAQAVLLSLLFP